MPKKPQKITPAAPAAPKCLKPLTPFSLLSPSDAADALGIGRTKLLAMVRTGRLPCRMLDGRIRIPVEALQAFRDALPSGYERQKPVKAAWV
jgi:excisionase family DNA binding protein